MSGKSLPDAIAREIGTIKIVWRDCVKVGKEFSDNCREYATVSSYKQANKTDAVATGGAGTGAGEGMSFSSTTSCGNSSAAGRGVADGHGGRSFGEFNSSVQRSGRNSGGEWQE
ncbi:hypothetical protein Esi_0037_0075 [Ectocarpus siliculosus]|uniref:Uncharacterized protein n=1 Tax=Ectocarpus siliculosus TaxID=2880 RepID=D8LLM7_ECTSI|nr:hypothetical protein Esi_0037_0075 [Ectocarpus siliculosus]|eukprot:CBN74658.1 hypothetical protein Esi_0037_0075 [Ectocarpus siliculosus]